MRASRLLPLLLLAGCATAPVVEEGEAVSSIGQRLLVPESAGGPGGGIEPWSLSGTEAFRMPEPLRTPLPQLPDGHAMQSLPATTVCLNVVVDAQGQVPRSLPLVQHSACGAGNAPGNAVLLQSAAAAVRQWRFRPAAICRFAPDRPAAAPDDCSGAAEVEDVPVTLSYAFTFEIVQGQARVRMDKPLR